jgi:hypothetical protein
VRPVAQSFEDRYPRSMRNDGKSWVLLTAFFSIIVLTGCTQTELTKPKRAATEQLLISTAADRALAQADLSIVNGKKIFVDKNYYDSADKEYVLGTVRDLINMRGGLLVQKLEDAEIVVEPRSGALSIDSTSSIIGLPSTPTPIPFAGAMQIPEIALYKSEKQFSIAKIALLAYERASGRHVASSGPLVGRANVKYYKFLGFITYNKTTIPERQKQTKEQKERQGH